MEKPGDYHTFEILPKDQLESLKAESPESYEAYMAFLAVEAVRQRDDIVELELIRREARLHPLTKEYGVLNKIAMDEELEALEDRLRTFTMRATDPNAIVLIYTDADRFKEEINDQFGQRVGDEAIKELARAHAGAVRDEEDFVGCDGGDEFVIAMPMREDGSGSAEEAAQLVIDRDRQNCREITVERVESGGFYYDLSCSYGVSVWRPNDGTGILDAKEEANRAMKRNKPRHSRR